MSEKELKEAIREIYMLWQRNKLVEDATEDIDFILDQVIKEMGE